MCGRQSLSDVRQVLLLFAYTGAFGLAVGMGVLISGEFCELTGVGRAGCYQQLFYTDRVPYVCKKLIKTRFA